MPSSDLGWCPDELSATPYATRRDSSSATSTPTHSPLPGQKSTAAPPIPSPACSAHLASLCAAGSPAAGACDLHQIRDRSRPGRRMHRFGLPRPPPRRDPAHIPSRPMHLKNHGSTPPSRVTAAVRAAATVGIAVERTLGGTLSPNQPLSPTRSAPRTRAAHAPAPAPHQWTSSMRRLPPSRACPSPNRLW